MHAHHVREASSAVQTGLQRTHTARSKAHHAPPAVGCVKLERICQQAVNQACTQVPAR
jgi:hypothetical protein